MNRHLAGLLAVLISLAPAAWAQGDADEPDTSATEDKTQAAERDELEPAVSSTPLADDVQRTTSDAQVMDELDLGRTEITGNQELPKVLYIVPWRKADPGELTGKPVNTLLDEVLAPVDRSEFIRQVHYYEALHDHDQPIDNTRE